MNYLTFHSIGGFRYVISSELPILKVFALEDGVIVKCLYNPKMLKVQFQRTNLRQKFERESLGNSEGGTYAYMTLTKHPYEKVYSLALRGQSALDTKNMIDCCQDLLYVCDKLPIAIYFDESTSEVVFCTLRNNMTAPVQEEGVLDFDTLFRKEPDELKECEFMDCPSRSTTGSAAKLKCPHEKPEPRLLAQVSSYSEIMLNPLGKDMIESGVKPDQFEIVNSFEENVFIIALQFSLLNETRFYRCQLGSYGEVFSVKLSAKVENSVKIHSIEFLRQSDMFIPKICQKQTARRNQNPEIEYLKERISYEFDKEILLLDSSGTLNIYKGDLPLLALLNDTDLPRLIPSLSPKLQITNISNPKKSRISLHFNDKDSQRFDFQFKGKLRDYCLQSCLHLMQKLLPLQVFYKFYEHFLYVVFITKQQSSQQSAWQVFTELFFSVLERNFSEGGQVEMGEKLTAFEKMMGSKTARSLLKGLKIQTKHHGITESSDRTYLCLKQLSNSLKLGDLNDFSHCAENIFEVLHLLHEDMKLNIFKHKIIQEGTFVEFLFRFCLKLGPTKFGYSEFYLREYPDLLTKYHKEYLDYKKEYRFQINEAKLQMEENKTNANFKIPMILSKNMQTIPSIYAWIEAKLDSTQAQYSSPFYCFFETTRKVCRLFDIFNGNEEVSMSQLHPLLCRSKNDETMEIQSEIDTESYPLFAFSEEYGQATQNFGTEDYYLDNRNLNYFERIVFCLKEERMGRDSIKKLPLGISLPIQEVLAHDYFKTIYVKSTDIEKKFIKEWPKEIFRLIEREDLYYNLQEMKKNEEMCEEAAPEFQFSRISTLNLTKTLSKRKSMFKLGRTESNVFANMKKSLVPKTQKAKTKQNKENEEEAETKEYMDLIEKEFKSLGIDSKKINENHFIDYRFSSDLRYKEV